MASGNLNVSQLWTQNLTERTILHFTGSRKTITRDAIYTSKEFRIGHLPNRELNIYHYTHVVWALKWLKKHSHTTTYDKPKLPPESP